MYLKGLRVHGRTSIYLPSQYFTEIFKLSENVSLEVATFMLVTDHIQGKLYNCFLQRCILHFYIGFHGN